MRCSILVLLLSVAVSSGLVRADEIVFKNGDRLTGRLEHAVGGKLVFNSDIAGKLTVDISNVETFSTDAPAKVHLSDGTVLNQQIIKASQGKIGIEDSQTLKAQLFDMTAVSSINPPPKPKEKWTGNISAGLTSTHGNTQTEAVNASVNLQKRTEKDRTQLSTDYAKGKQTDPDTKEETTTEDWWRARAKYDYFFTKKFYGYLDARYEKDSIAQLDRRVIIGAGGGYQWIESDDMNFATEIGLASVYEKFDNQTESNSELSAQLGYHFDKKLVDNIKFIHDLTYYPSIQKVSDYFLTTTAEVRAGISKNMFTNFKVILDYDTTPAQGSGKTDTKYLLGVGWNF